MNTFVGILLIRPLVAALLVYVFPIGLTGVWIALISDAVLCFFLAYRLNAKLKCEPNIVQ